METKKEGPRATIKDSWPAKLTFTKEQENSLLIKHIIIFKICLKHYFLYYIMYKSVYKSIKWQL